MSAADCTQPPSNCRGARLTGICATWPAQEIRTGHTARKLGTALRSLAFALKLSICEQWGLRAPLGAAELYREGPCCWRCLFPTSLMIRGHCPVFPDQQSTHHRQPSTALSSIGLVGSLPFSHSGSSVDVGNDIKYYTKFIIPTLPNFPIPTPTPMPIELELELIQTQMAQ